MPRGDSVSPLLPKHGLYISDAVKYFGTRKRQRPVMQSRSTDTEDGAA